MQASDVPYPPDDPAGNGLPLLVAAELQDHLMVAGNDLERLQGLLGDACDTLSAHFYGATAELQRLQRSVATQAGIDVDQLHGAITHLAGAITAMQFHDMATQLITHTATRLRGCADRIARDAMGDDEDGTALVSDMPQRPNPVTQDEMDAGSIELF